MIAYLADVGGQTRCRLELIWPEGAVIITREPLARGDRVKLTIASAEGVEMTALCEVTRGCRDGVAVLRILGWETDEDAPLLLVAQERVVH